MIVEPFIPRNHISEEGFMDRSLQKAEITFVSKALRLMAPMNLDRGEIVESISDARNRILSDIEEFEKINIMETVSL